MYRLRFPIVTELIVKVQLKLNVIYLQGGKINFFQRINELKLIKNKHFQ